LKRRKRRTTTGGVIEWRKRGIGRRSIRCRCVRTQSDYVRRCRRTDIDKAGLRVRSAAPPIRTTKEHDGTARSIRRIRQRSWYEDIAVAQVRSLQGRDRFLPQCRREVDQVTLL